jgi:regulator of replication initiation timing
MGGSGNITGEYVVVGSGTINASEQQLAKIPNEYAESLRAFSENINNQLQGRQVPQEQVESLKQSINNLSKELEDIKSGKEQEIDEEKRVNVEARTTSVIQRVLNVLPQAAENAATFTPLAPLSKLIGKGVQEIVNAIQRRKSGIS